MNTAMIRAIREDNGERSVNPTCTGTSVIAVAFDGGVAVLADRIVSYGKMAKFRQTSRIYRINSCTLISFGGDHADFQLIQNMLQRRSYEFKAECGDVDAEMPPVAIYSYLNALLYNRRTKMNPLWNTLVVVGMQSNGDEKKPFIGVVSLRGVAYTPNFVATGIGAMLVRQNIETEYRRVQGADNTEPRLTADQAIALLAKCAELVYYSDCNADDEYEIGMVTADGGAKILEPKKLTSKWEIATTHCDYE